MSNEPDHQDQLLSIKTRRHKEVHRAEELLRFKQKTSGQIPEGPGWKYVVRLKNPQTTFEKIMQLVEVVLTTSYLQWPDSSQWRNLLPQWFLDETPTLTREEANALLLDTPEESWDTLPWDFDSWTDAILLREWAWWSYRHADERLDIYLVLSGWPASLEALEHVFKAAGGIVVEGCTI